MFASPVHVITRRGGRLIVGALVGVAALGVPQAGGADAARVKAFTVSRLQAVSGPTPFDAGCPGAFHDADKVNDLEIEPAIAANPANQRNLIATWKQDVSGPFNARDDLIASSLDGGRTWRRTIVPGLTRCSGGTADTASDPWVSFGRDGTAYFGGQAGLMSTDPPQIAITASRSTDGGRRWTAPAIVAPALGGNEQPAVTASPLITRHAYMVWANFFKVIPALGNYTVQFSRTSDGGATWSPPVVISDPGPFGIDQAPRLRVLPDGTLLVIFARADFAAGIAELRVARSHDEGRTWDAPVVAGSIPLPGEVTDPETSEQLPQPGYPTSAISPDGTVYIAFENSPSASSGSIGLIRSFDGGLTWQRSELPDVNAFAWEPAIAVDQHGTVGVIWYDLRNNRPGDGQTTADVWFASSTDHGDSWHQIHVAGPTDIRTGAAAEQNRFGEYQGLAGLNHGFAAIFGLAAPQAKHGATDIFFAEIGPKGCHGEDHHQNGHNDC